MAYNAYMHTLEYKIDKTSPQFELVKLEESSDFLYVPTGSDKRINLNTKMRYIIIRINIFRQYIHSN